MSGRLPDHDDIASITFASSELVDLLEAMYPERSPEPEESERELWMRAGERRLVRKLRELRSQGERGRRL